MEDLFGVKRSDLENDWREHWKDMPEYIQHDKEAIKSVNVNFESLDDIQKFNRVTGLRVTMQTKGVFYPNKDSEKVIYVKD